MIHYHINVFYSDEDRAWVADIPDLQDLLGLWRHGRRGPCRSGEGPGALARSRPRLWRADSRGALSPGNLSIALTRAAPRLVANTQVFGAAEARVECHVGHPCWRRHLRPALSRHPAMLGTEPHPPRLRRLACHSSSVRWASSPADSSGVRRPSALGGLSEFFHGDRLLGRLFENRHQLALHRPVIPARMGSDPITFGDHARRICYRHARARSSPPSPAPSLHACSSSRVGARIS